MLYRIGEEKPVLRDLLSNVVHQYAACWRKLGLELGLEDYEIKNIAISNDGRDHEKVQFCCREMLELWLKKISQPTWGKLVDAINSLPDNEVLTGPKGIQGTKTLEIL